jgi:hypothetical protein
MSQRIMGNVNQRTFEEIWDDVPYRTFRRDLLSDEPPDECRGCAKAGWYHPYELEDWIEVGVNDTFGVQLGTGWSAGVAGVRWSRKEATLRLRNSGKRRLRLVLSSSPSAWTAYEQRGEIFVNDEPVGTFAVSGVAGEVYLFSLPAFDAAELMVRIACERENMQHTVDGTGDVRRLGIGLASAALVEDDATTEAPSR